MKISILMCIAFNFCVLSRRLKSSDDTRRSFSFSIVVSVCACICTLQYDFIFVLFVCLFFLSSFFCFVSRHYNLNLTGTNSNIFVLQKTMIDSLVLSFSLSLFVCFFASDNS